MKREGFIDRGIGESRGVVLLDGRPERLIVERDDDQICQRLGARSLARVRAVNRALGVAFLELPQGPDATAPAGRLAEGQAVIVEIVAEARAEKGAVARIEGSGEGAPRLLSPARSLEERLRAWTAAAPAEGDIARSAADAAEADALETVHALPGGGRISLEPTRALVAVDIDLAGRKGNDPRRLARQANLTAISEAARLLRLKSLGGAVVLDLVGKGHDGPAIAAAAKAAFAADEPGVSIGPISRFGLFELVVPHRFTPLAERLNDASGAPTTLTLAVRLMRTLEREGRVNSGARVAARGAPEVVSAAEPLLARLVERLGARLTLIPEPGRPRESFEISQA